MEKNKRILIVAFLILLGIVVVVSIVGIIMLREKPIILQGHIEAQEIRISGMLAGHVVAFPVSEGEDVKRGDTLVIINSPEAEAQYQQSLALKQVSIYQKEKIDKGNRKEVIASSKQIWLKTQSDLKLAESTYKRIKSLYADSVVTQQRLDEAEAMYQSAMDNERVASEQYQLAIAGAQNEDKKSAAAMVAAATDAAIEIGALLKESTLVSPVDGQISSIYQNVGELVGIGTPIMNIVVLDDVHVVLNVREDMLPHFMMDSIFYGDVPAIDKERIQFKTYFISPLGSYATWRSTKQRS